GAPTRDCGNGARAALRGEPVEGAEHLLPPAANRLSHAARGRGRRSPRLDCAIRALGRAALVFHDDGGGRNAGGCVVTHNRAHGDAENVSVLPVPMILPSRSSLNPNSITRCGFFGE